MSTNKGRPAVAVPSGNAFGAWLRKWRKERELTGEALAFSAGGAITQSSISHYERGTKKPEARTVFLLAEALGRDPAEALEALRQDVADGITQGGGAGHRAFDLANRIAALPDSDQAFLTEMVEKLLRASRSQPLPATGTMAGERQA